MKKWEGRSKERSAALDSSLALLVVFRHDEPVEFEAVWPQNADLDDVANVDNPDDMGVGRDGQVAVAHVVGTDQAAPDGAELVRIREAARALVDRVPSVPPQRRKQFSFPVAGLHRGAIQEGVNLRSRVQVHVQPNRASSDPSNGVMCALNRPAAVHEEGHDAATPAPAATTVEGNHPNNPLLSAQKILDIDPPVGRPPQAARHQFSSAVGHAKR
ncbi:excinuclease ABC subunit A [Babesia caballi]|uniref:Excinuclease ABC subunit A n=1 Tax=Babesia caballi TaxID=5871 RepID=A0AAV4LU01_BABCB|nr:excinuclease ABC subunit A [Babesia caballi]